MRFVVVFFLLFNIATVAKALNVYVKVVDTQRQEKVKLARYRLYKMQLHSFYRTTSYGYAVYSGPYKNNTDAYIALQRVQKYYRHAKIIQPKVAKKRAGSSYKSSFATRKIPLHISVGMSYASAPSTHTIISGTVQVKEPKNSGYSYTIEGEYDLSESFSAGLGYMRFDADDLLFDNFYAKLRYKFATFDKYTPYFSLLAGNSSLTWSVDPIANPTSDSNNDSTSLFLGTEVGLLYHFDTKVSFYSEYQCIFMGHTTNILVDTQNRSKLQHNILHTVQMGLQYNF